MRERVSSFDFGLSFFDGELLDQGQAIMQFLSPFLVELQTTLLCLEKDLELRFAVRKIVCNHEREIRRGTRCKAVRTLDLGERSIFMRYRITPEDEVMSSVTHEVVIVLKDEQGKTVRIPDRLREILG